MVIKVGGLCVFNVLLICCGNVCIVLCNVWYIGVIGVNSSMVVISRVISCVVIR